MKVTATRCVPVIRPPLFVPANHSAVRFTATRVFGPGMPGSVEGADGSGGGAGLGSVGVGPAAGLLAETDTCTVFDAANWPETLLLANITTR